MKSLVAEVGRWRFTWLGVAFAIGMPIYARSSPPHALIFFIVGLSMAISLHTSFDSKRPRAGDAKNGSK